MKKAPFPALGEVQPAREPLVSGGAPLFARRSAAVAAIGTRLVLFGGVGAAGTESILDVSDDCWSFDTEAMRWEHVPRSQPWPDARRCAGTLAVGGRMWLWGGSGLAAGAAGVRYTFLNDWWELDLAAGGWQQRRASDDHRQWPPSHRATHPGPRYTPLFELAAGRVFLCGGYTEDRAGKRKLNDVWLSDGDTWTEVEARGPDGYGVGAAWPGVRYGAMAASDGDGVFVCGGYADDGDHGDLWRFDVPAERWQLLVADGDTTAPGARYCAALAHDRGRVFLFGGRSRRFPKRGFNDLWMFDASDGRWQCLQDNRTPHVYGRGARFPAYHAKMAAAVVDRHWYLWGGEGAHGHVSDFWRFSFDNLAWEQVQAARPDDPLLW